MHFKTETKNERTFHRASIPCPKDGEALEATNMLTERMIKIWQCPRCGQEYTMAIDERTHQLSLMEEAPVWGLTSVKPGDQIECDNGQTYTIAQGDKDYPISLLDEAGHEVAAITEPWLDECLTHDPEDFKKLQIRTSDGESDYVTVLRFIKH